MNANKIIGGLLFAAICVAAQADQAQMRNASQEGNNVAKQSSGNVQNIMKSFNLNELPGYQSNPSETRYYQGGTATSSDLGSKGSQALNGSELSETVQHSMINNPKDKIDWESDILKGARDIQKNADVITGGVSNQCVKQVLSKNHFSYHYCEKDQQIESQCMNTAKIQWVGKKILSEDKVYIPHKSISFNIERMYRRRYFIDINVISPTEGRLVGFKLYYKGTDHYEWLKYTSEVSLQFLDVNVPINNWRTNERKEYGVYYHSKNIKPGDILRGQFITKSPFLITDWYSRYIRQRAFTGEHQTIDVELIVEKNIDTLKPEVEWEYICPINKNDGAVKTNEVCTQKGETRSFNRDGKNYPVTLDCWQKTETWLINEASDNECSAYEKNPNCTVGERECLFSENGNCVRHRIKYQCQHTEKTEGYLCGERFYCDDGSCGDINKNSNADFGQAVSQLAALAQAGKDIGLDQSRLKAFSGKAMYCRKSGFGFSNCCKDGGWGHSVGLAHCNTEEKALGQAKERKLTIYTGTYCDKKVLGVCIRRKSSYCVFDNKLARIVQYQGRGGQLGVGFGDAKNPNCRGLSVEELQNIKFDHINFSDFFDDLNSNKKVPDNKQLMKLMQGRISEQLSN
ncbi:conjugal transfer protein TraN [Testudinibacter sp. TR-2022]|uniref:conjugal transfer protein TraN n=1 Tax=Testudinibacter sp. TR-2022 TaxID=2585029 RepID=UPI00111B4C03|nr:conjugal transfer protein TraN [Testudinibacter sp. TR-2022]TNH04047.1 conjugal transfer protein TraN [Pasteurellaceae bacterium Phil31]TNH10168.1 conjugal transfer protein TraN [Testudinibacter sp. TR-2022]TNH13028.1 conjugal transfer protein TraN [Testudinibacter sp. TR-2022]